LYIPKRIKKEETERTICPVCKGRKVVLVKEDEKGKEKEIPCPRCGGRGYI
jgi:uncharacterized protein YbaR (Trm112 family)